LTKRFIPLSILRFALLWSLAIPALASTYSIVLTDISASSIDASGSFDYTPLAGFSSFQVVWDGMNFDLTAAANDPFMPVYAAGCDAANAATFFAVLTGGDANCPDTVVGWEAGTQMDGVATFWIAQETVYLGGFPSVVAQTFSTGPATVTGAGGPFTLTDASTMAPEPGSIEFILEIAAFGLVVGSKSLRRKPCLPGVR
jgi:hypothetical protein